MVRLYGEVQCTPDCLMYFQATNKCFLNIRKIYQWTTNRFLLIFCFHSINSLLFLNNNSKILYLQMQFFAFHSFFVLFLSIEFFCFIHPNKRFEKKNTRLIWQKSAHKQCISSWMVFKRLFEVQHDWSQKSDDFDLKKWFLLFVHALSLNWIKTTMVIIFD